MHALRSVRRRVYVTSKPRHSLSRRRSRDGTSSSSTPRYARYGMCGNLRKLTVFCSIRRVRRCYEVEVDLCTHARRVSPQTSPVCGDDFSGRSASSGTSHSQAPRRLPSLQDDVSVRNELHTTSLSVSRCENCGYYCTLPFGASRSSH
jgi:hypothetical protein